MIRKKKSSKYQAEQISTMRPARTQTLNLKLIK